MEMGARCVCVCVCVCVCCSVRRSGKSEGVLGVTPPWLSVVCCSRRASQKAKRRRKRKPTNKSREISFVCSCSVVEIVCRSAALVSSLLLFPVSYQCFIFSFRVPFLVNFPFLLLNFYNCPKWVKDTDTKLNWDRESESESQTTRLHKTTIVT